MTDFWNNVLKPAERVRLVDNIASHLCNAQQFIQVGATEFLEISCDLADFITLPRFAIFLLRSQDRAVNNFSKVHADFGSQLKGKLEHYRKQPKKPLAHL